MNIDPFLFIQWHIDMSSKPLIFKNLLSTNTDHWGHGTNTHHSNHHTHCHLSVHLVYYLSLSIQKYHNWNWQWMLCSTQIAVIFTHFSTIWNKNVIFQRGNDTIKFNQKIIRKSQIWYCGYMKFLLIMETSASKRNKYIIWYWVSNPLIKFVKTEIRKEYFVQHYLLCEIQPKWVKGM